jgi:hypothetical protein
MRTKSSGLRVRARAGALALATAALGGLLVVPAYADDGFGHDHGPLRPGNLLVSTSVFKGDANIIAHSTVLPPNCVIGCVTANAGGAYPEVFDNDLVDESFGVTSKIYLHEITPSGVPVSTIEVPSGSERHGRGGEDQMVTSFSSKSELALNLSTGGRYVTFMGYLASPDELDVSNSNTPAVFDPTNPDPGKNYRLVAEMDSQGKFHFTETNAYSGNNGRAAILNEEANELYTAGNAGNGGNPQPEGVIVGAGAQIIKPSFKAEILQEPGFPTPLGSFSVTQLGDKADKVGKDTNFRGLTISNNVVYYTKGSGGNGVNTVYFVDTTGKACPNGVGLPAPGAPLPTSPLAYNAAALAKEGLVPNNMCILKGFPTTLKTKTAFPFGIWFANANTLYVADEGNGENTYSTVTGQYTAAASQTTAGLQKWVFNTTANEWKLAYTLQAGLGLGAPYTVPGYPTGDNPATGLPWAPATDGLRNIVGRVNDHGTATIWGITSTVSGGGDQGADPNRLVAITDPIAASTPAGGESFATVRQARDREVLRGVSFTPTDGHGGDSHGGDSHG